MKLRMICIAALALAAPMTAGAVDHTVVVNEDGTYDPVWLNISDGDTVTWEFPDRQRSVARVHPDGTGFPNWCEAYLPYDPNDPNEFTGPMPVAASGVFALGPKELGLASYASGDASAPCNEASATVVNGRFLCPGAGAPNAPLQEVLDANSVAGVFLRFNWSDIETAPGVYDWTNMDAQIDRVVAAGKLYSLAFKAGKDGRPDWLFDDLGMIRHAFRDTGGTGALCGVDMELPDPTEAIYGDRYSLLMQAAASHIMENPAWYRALAYIKPSGANLHSHENRLPKRCEPTCPVCNTEVWANAGYTPQGIYDFYEQQFIDLWAAYPGKSMSYMLIQAGFPRVASTTEYLGCPTAGCEAAIPGGVEQTTEIMDIGAANHGLDFVIQHNGLQKETDGACFGAGVHPMVGSLSDFKSSPGGCPNPYVVDAAARGLVTGFQTNNTSKIADMAALDGALQNAELNSDAVFVEAYERVLWEAIEDGGAMDPAAATPRSLMEWNRVFLKRRRHSQFTSQGLEDPFPKTHSHTFTRTIGALGAEIYHYVDPATCGDAPANYGVIRILP